MARLSSSGIELTLEERVRSVADDLRGHLNPIVREVAGSRPRPSRLVSELDIDKSLASRLTRALRAEDPLEFMHLLPSPTGLGIFLTAARSAGIRRDVCRAAEDSVDAFRFLLEALPGGRATLDAAISASSGEARAHTERNAKQAVYKAMSYLVGIRCESIATTFAIQPAADGRMVDALDMHQRIGIRRLRPTAPLGVSSIRLHPPSNGKTPLPFMETLDGDPVSEVQSYFLPEFSSPDLPEFHMFTEGSVLTTALPESDPPLESPLDLTSATVIRNVLERYRTKEIHDEWRGYLLHLPCKTLVRDVYIHEDLYPGMVPEITLHIPSPKGAETVRHPGLHGRLNTLDLATPVESLGLGMNGIAIRGIRRYPELVHTVFERAGWDRTKFRGYRTRVTYPVPMILMTWWFSLPERPAGDGG
jgi:hypothetical protein